MKCKGDISEFNALVTKCACSNKKDAQVSYLVKVVMKVMAKQFGKGKKIPDSLGIPEIEALAKKDVHTACSVLDGLYSFLSKSLLDHPDFNLRAKVISGMQKELKDRQEAKQIANI